MTILAIAILTILAVLSISATIEQNDNRRSEEFSNFLKTATFRKV